MLETDYILNDGELDIYINDSINDWIKYENEYIEFLKAQKGERL